MKLPKMKKVCLLIILILAVAFIIRFNNIGQKSVWYDEYLYYVVVQNSCQETVRMVSPYKPLTWFHDHPYLSLYFLKLSCFTQKMETMRLINVIFTVLGIFVAYKLAEKMFGVKVGLLTSLLLAISPTSVAFGRIGILEPVTIFFLLLSCYVFFLKKEKTAWFIGGVAFAAKFSAAILIPLFIFMDYIKKKFSIRKSLRMLVIFGLAVVVFTFGSFVSWDYLSLSKNLNYKVPVIAKAILFEMFFRPATAPYSTNLSSVPKIISDQITIPILVLCFAVMILHIFVRKKILFHKQKYEKLFVENEKPLIFLYLWLFLGIGLLVVFPGPYICFYMLFPVLILVSFAVFNSMKFGKISFLIILIILGFYLFVSVSDIVSSRVYFSPYKNQYSYYYFSLVRDSIDYVNKNSDSQDSVYIKSLGGLEIELKEPPNDNESIKIRRNITERIEYADYVLVSLRYTSDKSNSEEIKWIDDNLKLEKTFGSNTTAAIFIYKRA